MAGLSTAVVAGSLVCTLYTPVTHVLRHKKPVPVIVTPDTIRAKARILYGQEEIKWKCLDTLWTMESHWNFRAKGARTTQGRALGIPQALPAIKMKSMGTDYVTNPMTQVKWGLKYIKTRYQNNACYALRHELLRGWY